MGRAFINLTNQVFVYWTVSNQHKSVPRPSGKGSPRTHWFCTCVCGNTAWVDATNLRQGISQSCGCKPKNIVAGVGSPAALAAANANRTHGMSRTPIYHCYRAMLARCYNPKERHYKWYGAKGISVCDRWRESFQNFFADMGRSFFKGASLERDNVKLGYSPENCRWIPRREQNWNKTNTVKLPNGEQLRQFCYKHGLDFDAFYYQIEKKGLTLEETLQLFKIRIE